MAEESEFEAYMRGMEERMSQRLEATVADVRQDQAKLAEYIQNGSQLRNQPPQPRMPDNEVGEKILKAQFEDPTRFWAEVGELNRQQAAAIAKQAIEDYAKKSEANAAHREFWTGFSDHNRDLAAFLPQVQHIFGSLPANMDASRRADEAAKQVRELITQRRADAVEADRRQTSQARMTATPNAPANPAAQRPENQREMTGAEAAADAIADMEAFRAKRMVYG